MADKIQTADRRPEEEHDGIARTPVTAGSALDHRTAHYPAWAKILARKYFTKTLAQFILHGNIRDLVPTRGADGEAAYVPLRDFLTGDLFAARDVVVFYDRSAGIHFADDASQRDFNRALSGYDTIFGTDYAREGPTDPKRAFTLLENYFRLRLADGKRVACVIDYAETVAPMAEAATYSAEDRAARVFLQKWARDPLFLERDFTICLLTENLADLNQQLVRSPYSAEVCVPLPGEDDRRAFIQTHLEGRQETFASHSEVALETLARHTAGLGFTQLRTLLADVLENRTRLTFDALTELKKEFIEAEAHGLLEFVETDLDLGAVAGHTEAKAHLRRTARALREGRPEVLPMGYLVSGPVGTGKTFLITCFAGEIGIPMVKLKNFRSQWQGVTEGNLEKIFALLEAMTPVAVMIDEADAALGTRDSGGDAGVSKRVFARIAAFMSKPEHRGRILFFLVTARPDLMPVDLKRQGRAEEHLSLFYPSTRKEREELLHVMMRRTGVELPAEDVPDVLLDDERPLSGADLEALFTRAAFRAEGGDDGTVTPELLEAVTADFIPPTYPLEIERQTLAAVLECTRRALLPPPYRTMDRQAVADRFEELNHIV